MSEMEIAKLFNAAFGPVTGSILAVIMLVLGGKFLKPQLAGADAQAGLIKDLKDEADKWQTLYDETHKLLTEQRETNVLLRSQNAMMRLLLVQKGVTESELVAIGAIHPLEHHEKT